MATNYAEKFAPNAVEAFALASVTDIFTGQYEWVDALTVKVFTNETVALGAYNRTGGYGTPTTIGNSVDTLTVGDDASFSANLDKLAVASTAGALKVASWTGEQTRQQVVPYIDAYRFDALWDACPTGQISAGAAITSANAYTAFMTGQTALDEALVPKPGRFVFGTPAFINSLKMDANYVKASELGQDLIFNGQVGKIDGVPVISVPSSLLNKTDHHMDFILVYAGSVVAPMKLEDLQVYESVPGWSGSRVEGRYVHDLFVLDTLSAGLYIHKHA